MSFMHSMVTIFFIPLLGFQQVLLPVIRHNFGAGQRRRIQQIVWFLKAVWWTFPLTELIAAAICIMFEKSQTRQIETK